MSRKFRIFFAAGLGLVAMAGLALAFYGALRRSPSYYEAALDRDSAAAARSSDEFLQSAAGVASDVRRRGSWDALFTADQINGWLAVDVPRNFPDLLPAEFAAPRVFIHPGDLTIACRYRSGSIDTVLSIACDVYLQSPSVLAIRIKSAKAGLLPLPLGKVLDAITHAAEGLELPLEWRRSGGDPVALVALVPPHARGRERVSLEGVELGEGEILVTGHTGETGPVAVAAHDKHDEPLVEPTSPTDAPESRINGDPVPTMRDALPTDAPVVDAPPASEAQPEPGGETVGDGASSSPPASASTAGEGKNDTLQR